MKKHFLLLLMAFFSLAGWATDVTVTLYDFTIPYGAEPTAATLKTQYPSAVRVDGASWDDIKGYLTFARVDDGSTNWNSNNVGVYSWTLTKALNTGDYTIYLSSNNAKLTIEKATITQTVAGVLAGGCAYNDLVNPLQLVTTAPTLSLAEAQETIEYSLDGENWSTTKPSVKKVAVHHVYYRVPATSNWNAKTSVEIGTVEITGTALTLNTDYTAPQLVEGALSFQWDADNGEAVEQTLITAGTTPTNHGKLYYSVDGGAWSEDLPTASAAGDHVVSWKVVGDEGYYDVAPANLTAKNIAAVQPTVIAATGATTSLVWTGEAQDLLSAAGSATLGATSSVKYTVQYKAAEADGWGPEGEAIDNFENVEGTAAGYYQINTKVLGAGNYLAAAADPITVQIATKPAFTAAPTAKDLTWNNAAQQLIAAGTGTVAGKVLYQLETNGEVTVAWTDNIENIKATEATKEGNAYVVKYKVEAANYTPVAATAIANVKIKKKVLSVKVNDVKKTYNGTADIDGDAAVVDGLAAFTYIGRVEATFDFSAVAYDAIDAANKTAGTHEGVLKATTTSLEGVSTNYDYTIIPGNLIIEQKAITVTAKTGLNADYLEAYDISGQYTIAGLVGTEGVADAFSTAPVLTTTAAASKPEPATYPIAFTKGTLKANGNYKMSDTGDGGYVIPEGANFVVNPDASSKIVITVLPKTYTYGETEDYTNFVAGTDYYVTGLIGSDKLKTAPTFSRSDADNKNVGTYELIAENAAIDEAIAGRYPGGIIYNNSTVEIVKKAITVTVNTQTIVAGTDDQALAQLDQDAWSVGDDDLQYGDTKESLKGEVANMLTPKAGVAAAAGSDNEGIIFAFNNANYKLAEGCTGKGKLIVLAAGSLILDCSKADNAEKIAAVAAQDDPKANVTIDFSTCNAWKANKWVTMTLPFDISVADLSKALGYAIVNVIDDTKTEINGTSSKFYGKLTMKGGNGYNKGEDDEDTKLAANKPFMVKIGDDIVKLNNSGVANFGLQTIVAPASDADLTVNAGGGAKLIGTYATRTVTPDDNKAIWFLTGSHDKWLYIGNNGSWDINPFQGFIDMSATAGARSMTFFFEEIDGSTTAIKGVSIDDLNNKNAEGWYNLNGMKMDGAPLQKGIYIKDGKKVVIK